MELMRQSWTDERLDDLRDEVARVRDEVARQGARIDALGSRVDDGFARLDSRIDSLNHTLAYVGAGLVAAFLSFLAALFGLIITQL
jgi:hypothetical protein